jgi:hypothetical protein
LHFSRTKKTVNLILATQTQKHKHTITHNKTKTKTKTKTQRHKRRSTKTNKTETQNKQKTATQTQKQSDEEGTAKRLKHVFVTKKILKIVSVKIAQLELTTKNFLDRHIFLQWSKNNNSYR